MDSVLAPFRAVYSGVRTVAALDWLSALFGLAPAWKQPPRPTVVQADKEEPAEPERRKERDAGTSALAGKRVLICEDEGISQMQLRRALIRGGMVVVGAAANGQAAVELALRTTPDIILMDIRMPVMDGIEALRRIRAQMQPCVIMLTAFSDEGYRTEAEEAGATGYIVKPVSGDTLLPALEKIWDRYSDPL